MNYPHWITTFLIIAKNLKTEDMCLSNHRECMGVVRAAGLVLE